jgi:alkylation response protein AidB-like acyl-CoA dehydrogenase
MDFNFSPEDEAFRAAFRLWLEQNRQYSPPTHEVLADELEGDWDARVQWHQRLHAGGWMGIHWPKEYGGRGATILQNVIYQDELERAGAALPFTGFGISLLGPTLIHWGNDDQKRRHLPKILAGEEFWCQGYSEPNSGSDLASLQTRAVEDGDDFVVNGAKIWTSAAQHADWIFLLVRSDPDAPKHKGISYLLVDMKTPGITIRPLVQMTGARGFNQVFFDDVRVPRKNLVGEKNQGWQVAITTLMFERASNHDRGLLKSVSDLADLARRVPRNGGSAWDDTSVRQRIATLKAEGEAIRYTNLRNLTRQLKGLPPGPESSTLKLCATELALQIASFGMELLGPYSQVEAGSPFALDAGKWSQRMLAARGPTIYTGTNEIQHNIIGERVLGLPKG